MPALPTMPTFTAGQRLYASQLTQVAAVGTYQMNKPAAVLTQATAQSLLNNSAAAVKFDAHTLDSHSGHSDTVNNTRYTAQYPGWYRVRGQVTWGPNATNDRSVTIYVNGSQIPTSWNIGPAAGLSFATGREVNGLVYLAIGDYVEIWASQNTGSTINTFVGTVTSSMQIIWDRS